MAQLRKKKKKAPNTFPWSKVGPITACSAVKPGDGALSLKHLVMVLMV